jgi:hypothetical protein
MHIPWPSRPVPRALAAVAVALLCGAAVFLAAHAHLARVAGAEAARLSQVTAVILEPPAPEESRPAIGQWPAGDGTLRAGVIHASPDTSAGDPHPVWIDQRGQLSHPPASAAQRAAQAVAGGGAVSAAVLAVLTRRQPDDVDSEWRRVSRDWRRRYQ